MSKVSIKEIKEILGVTTNSIAELCRHENINMFSRHKPVVYPGIPDGNQYFESIHNNFAIVIPERGISVSEHGWIYQRPSGGMNSPYRIDDFRGYNHGAEPVLKRLETEYIVEIVRDPVLRVNFSTEGEISVNEVLLNYIAADDEALIRSLGGLYIVMDILQNGKTITTIKANKTIGAGGLSLTYDCSYLKDGFYYLSFYLSTYNGSHTFDIYTNADMPNPARLEVITPFGADNFEFNVLGTADGEKNFRNINKRISVYFNTEDASSLKSGLYIIADIRNSSTSGLPVKWQNFSLQMRPNFYPEGITNISLYNGEINGQVFENEQIIKTDYGIEIPAGKTARIGIYLTRTIRDWEALISGNYDITTDIIYNNILTWSGLLLIKGVTAGDDISDDLKEINKLITGVQAEVNDLQSEVKIAQGNISDLNTSLSEIEQNTYSKKEVDSKFEIKGELKGEWQEGQEYTRNNRVSYRGCMYLCIVDSTYSKPGYDSHDWFLEQGNPDFVMDIQSSNGDVFIGDNVDTDLIAEVRIYNQDITSTIPSAQWTWTRSSSYKESDLIWNAAHVGVGNSVHITLNDLPGLGQRIIAFTCTVYVDNNNKVTQKIVI